MTSEKIVELLLGPAWHAVALPLSILLAATPFQVFGGLTGALVYAKGRGRMQFWISNILIVGRVAAVLVAGWVGITYVATIVAIITIIYSFVAVSISAEVAGICPPLLWRGLLAPFVCAITACGVCEVAVYLFGSQILTLVIAVIGSFLLYIGLLVMLEPRQLLDDIAMFRALVRKQPVT